MGQQPEVWGAGVLGQARLLTGPPLSQEAPPPLVPPQLGASPDEDRTPPYDEQTQALIDGERLAGVGGGRGPPRPAAHHHPTCSPRWVWAGPLQAWRGSCGVWGSQRRPHMPQGPSCLLTGCCLFVPPSEELAGPWEPGLHSWEPRTWAAGRGLPGAGEAPGTGAILGLVLV